MNNKIRKLFSMIRKYGLLITLKKFFKYIHGKYLHKLNIFSYIHAKLNYQKLKKEIEIVLQGNYDRVIIWKSSFGWNVPLFQRPQHIAKCFANSNCLVFYEITNITDDIKTYEKIQENLYLINLSNNSIKNLLFNELKKINKPKYIQFYSTDHVMSLDEMKNYILDGYKIIYEYIDDLSPLIVGTKELPSNIKEKYEYMLSDTENVFTVVTADNLEEDVVSKRGREKLVFSCNGVDYSHFKNIDLNFNFDKNFLNIINQNKPIIGYYGALASWFDFDMVKYLAKEKPEYNIVLLGVKYDNCFDKAGLNKFHNIYFLGAKPYNILPNYASHFDVCMIPFLINDITQATSPLKLFEYMALGKPIITTQMKECKKYKSVMIANNKEEFVSLVEKALAISKEHNMDYFNLLQKEALANTWQEKAQAIINLLKKYEN